MTPAQQAAKAIKEATGWDASIVDSWRAEVRRGQTILHLNPIGSGVWLCSIRATDGNVSSGGLGEGPTPGAAIAAVLPRYRAHIASLAADILPGWPRLEWGEWQKQSPSFPYAVAALTFEAWGARRAVAKLISRDGTVCGWDNERVYYPGMTPETVRAAMIAHVESLGLPCPLPPFPGASDA